MTPTNKESASDREILLIGPYGEEIRRQDTYPP